MTFGLEIPMNLPSRGNVASGKGWRDRAKLVKKQHETLARSFFGRHAKVDNHRLDVLLTRVAPRDLDDDNLRQSLKAVRDFVAEWLGLSNDRDPRVRWEYAQDRDDRPRYQAARIQIEPRADCPHCGRPMIGRKR